MINFNKLLFMNLLFSSTFISISATSWFTAWIGLEMNLLAFIPLMKTKSNKFSSEASIKYFIIQAMGSSCFLFFMLLFLNLNFIKLEFNMASSILINLTLILKMGAAPLHFWLPEVVSGMEWNSIMFLLTWQKITPMILMYYSIYSPLLITLITILSSFISSVQGMNQISLRKFMAFSSINHTGWMLCTLMISLSLWFLYFMIYLIMSLNILSLFNKFQIYFINQLTKLFFMNKKLKFIFMLNFFSLGGLPPFIGFMPKWVLLNLLMNSKFFLLSFMLLMFTLLILYMYIRLTIPSALFNILESFTNPMKNLKPMNFFFNSFILYSLPLCLLMTQFF
uniref:NADH-ubiquinone oxidoreductase chain 2 n=1 Tax=Trigonopterus sp. 7 AH-2016 TaxID=1903841 RepID=A0A343C424_9CUCU|nr:NADH dehydrogenase subunit 2 [Trigonopterus sp. 7 AH-2016]